MHLFSYFKCQFTVKYFYFHDFAISKTNPANSKQRPADMRPGPAFAAHAETGIAGVQSFDLCFVCRPWNHISDCVVCFYHTVLWFSTSIGSICRQLYRWAVCVCHMLLRYMSVKSCLYLYIAWHILEIVLVQQGALISDDIGLTCAHLLDKWTCYIL